ncbi:MAG: hypothetical protein ACM3SO_05175 [Betaproteobacteria bacterium]
MTNLIRNSRITAVVAAALLATSAGAATVSECITDVQIAKNDINDATTFVSTKDQVGLSGKADSAMQKLDMAKLADASQVLADMAAKVTTLATAAKPKLGAADAALISADISTAQACVTQLMTQ